MARTLDGSTEYFIQTNGLGIGDSHTLAYWGKPGSGATTTIDIGLSVADSTDGTYNEIILGVAGTIAGDPCYFQVRGASASNPASASSTTGITAGTWHHFCGWQSGLSSRAAYIDGGSKGTDVTSILSLGTLDRTVVGARGRSGLGLNWEGDIAWPCIWSEVLSDEEIAALGRGWHPLLVRPEAILSFGLFSGATAGNEIDYITGGTFTETGTVLTAESPMVAFPTVITVTRDTGGAPAATPKGPLGLPLHGPLAGPI